MKLYFVWKNDKEREELTRIVKAEIKRHFNRYITLYEYFTIGNQNAVQLHLWDEDFFNDIQRAKKKMYEDGYMHLPDFVSDVEDNLSFVTKIICG